MDRIQQKRTHRISRHSRIRQRIRGTSDRPRCVIYRSHQYISVQVIDDVAGKTIASARVEGTNMNAAKDLATQLVQGIKKLHIKALVFDRGGYSYHGVVKHIAEVLRQEGLEL